MKNNRRDFLKLAGIAGLSIAGSNTLASCSTLKQSDLDSILKQSKKSHKQIFNMCNYAAPKLDTVRVGFLGVGNRGAAAVTRVAKIDGVIIKAIADLSQDRIEAVKKKLNIGYEPVSYSSGDEDWKKLCERDDIDLIYIATHWELHTPMAVYAMSHGKHVCVELPAATSIEECWQLVETSERTKKHCKILENCCYDFFELLTLNMARQGFFGDIVHCEGAYIHDLAQGTLAKNKYWDMWRLKENSSKNGNLYPTHGLGPVSQVMNLNRGDRMDYLTTTASNDFVLRKNIERLAKNDPFYTPYVGKNFRGNMNTTNIRTMNGRTIMIQHDVSSPRPYSRIHLVSGTEGAAQKYPLPGKIYKAHSWTNPDDWRSYPKHEWLEGKELKSVEAKYTPEIISRIGEMAKKVGGHGGMDFLMDWTTIDCLRNGSPMDIDVYDAALWSCILPLSEWSIANRSNSIDVPDFTNGAWKQNKELSLSLSGRGNTKANL